MNVVAEPEQPPARRSSAAASVRRPPARRTDEDSSRPTIASRQGSATSLGSETTRTPLMSASSVGSTSGGGVRAVPTAVGNLQTVTAEDFEQAVRQELSALRVRLASCLD